MSPGVRMLDETVLAAWPLPQPDAAGDKETRGRVAVIAGCREMPGAALLCAGAALRAGAGKVVVVIEEEAALPLALALPEARVIGWRRGTSMAGICEVIAGAADAVVVGPGMQPEQAACEWAEALFAACGDDIPFVLDAAAMRAVRAGAARRPSNLLLTPHAGELASLLDVPKEEIAADAAAFARRAAEAWQAGVVLKGAETMIAMPAGALWRHAGHCPGLAISGSGDVLAGLIAGLAARGAPLEQAAAWGVALHARAGRSLAERCGPLGFLASELAAEVPALMARYATCRPASAGSPGG